MLYGPSAVQIALAEHDEQIRLTVHCVAFFSLLLCVVCTPLLTLFNGGCQLSLGQNIVYVLVRPGLEPSRSNGHIDRMV